MRYKIVFFDVDGTLLNEKKQIPLDAKEAVCKLRERGVEVVIATGRAPFHCRSIAEELGIDSFVSFNGSYVVSKGQPIYQRMIGKATLESLEQFAREWGHPLVFLGSQECYSNCEQHPHVTASFAALQLKVPRYRPDYWRTSDIYQAFLYCEAHEEHPYTRRFSDLSFIRWHRFAMDVLPAGGSKARGVEAMLKHLGLSPSEAVAFGDGVNDKEMLAFVGMGIAMGNADREVKRFAKFVTKHVNEGGIRYGLEQIQLL
ncbi:Cof-type HAD-IIB family hydrolase [Effusibacillus pohliae]|uniref:Cof-type HAD-IIB family hydrolase n=1 Tax=Effusibacillus pohliae TaxID=232270 RepID=UPI0003631ADE|nr:Cof-type HAD-IIB family hydrolase [Effusibacillus pohliae]